MDLGKSVGKVLDSLWADWGKNDFCRTLCRSEFFLINFPKKNMLLWKKIFETFCGKRHKKRSKKYFPQQSNPYPATIFTSFQIFFHICVKVV